MSVHAGVRNVGASLNRLSIRQHFADQFLVAVLQSGWQLRIIQSIGRILSLGNDVINEFFEHVPFMCILAIFRH